MASAAGRRRQRSDTGFLTLKHRCYGGCLLDGSRRRRLTGSWRGPAGRDGHGLLHRSALFDGRPLVLGLAGNGLRNRFHHGLDDASHGFSSRSPRTGLGAWPGSLFARGLDCCLYNNFRSAGFLCRRGHPGLGGARPRGAGAACLFPGPAGRTGALARAAHFALGVLDALARALELLFGKSDALLGDIDPQARACDRGGEFGVGFRRLASWCLPDVMPAR
jgi:hypothetical protein